ncbi:MAG: ATP-binding protein, partial [Acidobacteriota bacterium]
YWEVSINPILDENGKSVRLVSTSRDMTERKEAENEREKLLQSEQTARQEAEIANRMRDEFLATVSHELRAPLNSILGWGKMLQQGKLDAETGQKAIDTIVRNANAQNRLIEDLLDVSRIISGKVRLEVIKVKLNKLIEAALESARPAAEAKNIQLNVIENSHISHISGDPNRLQQVIWNLLSNAIKFTPHGGEVTVEIKRGKTEVEILVSDSGIGIKEEFLPHIFKRFSQADSSSIRKFGGLGLGLAIVRHIVEMHGGSVSVYSEGENKGATFTVTLPLIVEKRQVEDNLNTQELKKEFLLAQENIKLEGLLILVVDDEIEARQMLIQALILYGATVVSASSVKEAFDEINIKKPDIIVSDIGMPEEDGYAFIKQLRSLPNNKSNIPAIALTAFSRSQDRTRALMAGFQNHVSKPVEIEELVTVIAGLTGRLQNIEMS